jgi:hypothetical protein
MIFNYPILINYFETIREEKGEILKLLKNATTVVFL